MGQWILDIYILHWLSIASLFSLASHKPLVGFTPQWWHMLGCLHVMIVCLWIMVGLSNGHGSCTFQRRCTFCCGWSFKVPSPRTPWVIIDILIHLLIVGLVQELKILCTIFGIVLVLRKSDYPWALRPNRDFFLVNHWRGWRTCWHWIRGFWFLWSFGGFGVGDIIGFLERTIRVFNKSLGRFLSCMMILLHTFWIVT